VRLENRNWDEWEQEQRRKQERSFRSLGVDALTAAIESSVHWNRMYAETQERERNEIREQMMARK
jgi:hypothetical protein